MMKNTIYHHGIKGMKWGVRRYQNYDGSYTKRGLERYKKAESNYNDARKNQKNTRSSYKNGLSTKNDVKEANRKVKTAKKELNKAYDRLKTDKLADEGKALYRKGHTITANTSLNFIQREAITLIGSNVVSGLLAANGNYSLALLSERVIGIGGTAANVVLGIKSSRENRRLRAYYAH